LTEAGGGGLPATWEEEFQERPTNHHYCYGLIHLFLELVLRAATSLGAASETLRVMRSFLPWLGSVPTADCGQLWMLRVGLYEVTRPKEFTSDRVWIVDHTVQIGTTKCLLIVSVGLSSWQEQGGPLSHQDLEVLALEPVEKSDGQIVQKQLEETATMVGTPRAIVSDHGTDIKRGIEAFQVDHPETLGLYDIAHKTAILVKRELEADEVWSEYLKHIGQAKQRLLQTPLAFLTPPTPKNKARYMNLGPLVNWGTKTLAYLDNPQPVTDEPVNKKQLREKLSWLRKYRKRLVRWDAMMRVVTTTLEHIRQEGYHRRAVQELRRELKLIAKDPQSRRLADKIQVFVKEQSAHIRKGEHLIGSSECIESLIGKGKRLEGQQSKSGFTRMVLGMAAAVVNPTKEYLEQALATVKTHDVIQWCRENLGVSVQAQRRRALTCSSSGTKTG
jgi:hypothetical protein